MTEAVVVGAVVFVIMSYWIYHAYSVGFKDGQNKGTDIGWQKGFAFSDETNRAHITRLHKEVCELRDVVSRVREAVAKAECE